LITKYFDYAQAKLPIVVSDVETMGRTTIELGNGEVFTAQSTDGFVEAVRKVLLDPSQYARNYTPSALENWTWEAQSEKLIGLYKTLLVGPQNPVALTDSAQ
jgi:glycosyltransferase involved in cell wall biosynthesis